MEGQCLSRARCCDVPRDGGGGASVPYARWSRPRLLIAPRSRCCRSRCVPTTPCAGIVDMLPKPDAVC